MSKKRKLTKAEKAEKAKRKREYMTVFINGKKKRVKRPQMIDGLSVDEFIANNADDLWYHQNEMWECIEVDKGSDCTLKGPERPFGEDEEYPF